MFLCSSDLSHSETRVNVSLDDVEFHVYNRSAVYGRLEKLFGLIDEEDKVEEPEPPPVTKKKS